MIAQVQKTLPNGLRVIVLELPHLHSVSVALMVKAGPRYESPSTSGLSHLLEHLLFRGTSKHPSSVELNAAIEELGGEVNGLTQRDAMTIHMTVPPRSAEAGLGLLAEMCTTPRFPGLAIEKQVVIEEILDTIDSSGLENDIDTLSRSALWAGHPISMPVAGTVANVESFTLRQVRAHFRRCFVAENAVLCVAGPVSPSRIFAAAAHSFAKMPQGKPLSDGPVPRPAHSLPIQIQETEDSQVSVLLTVPAPHENDPRFSALLLLRRILDDGFSSRLRQAVSEQRGLAYSVAASIDVYADTGAMDLDATCAPRKLVVTVAQMLSTLKTLAEDGIEPAELERAKIRHRAELEFGLDDSHEICGWYGSAALIGSHQSYADRLAEAMRVTKQDVEALARDIFDPARAVVTLVGPAHPSAISKLERMLGRSPGSTLWLGEEDDGTVEPVEAVDLRGLSEWAEKGATKAARLGLRVAG